MKVSRLQIRDNEGYWAGNVVEGLGRGTQSLLYNTIKGFSGVLYEPYIGAKMRGIKGGSIGFFKGLTGLIFKPIRGCFDFVTQPVAGFLNTPNYIYTRMRVRNAKPRHRITFQELS